MESINNLADFYFHQGTNFNAYKYLGCNLKKIDNKYIYSFRVWAKNADFVGVISDFFGWDTPKPMNRITDGGIWELVYPSDVSLEGQAYKFRVIRGEQTLDKGDPYAKASRGYDDGASLIYPEGEYAWEDGSWLEYRKQELTPQGKYYLNKPINIYEVHLGSFIRHTDGSYYTYRELADIIAPYVKSMGYTHVETLPVQEYPYDGSWGYQPCAFYSPTCRFGTPDDFKYFVDKMHRCGIGVIMDWVCAHFPKDAWGLYNFDGGALYEYQGDDRVESSGWGTRFFDLGREEVQCFLISCALYYLREFHIDGLRVDAVASMIYLDYDKKPGEWIPNVHGTNENLEATAFLRKLNSAVFSEFPDVIMVAEESGSHSGVTTPISDGGLGFSMKWNMGFANDFYEYLSLDPIYRRHFHKALNFPIMYAFSENYCLPISHDEVVHGKRSFIDKIYGSYGDKFEQARSALMLIMTYPGKKLMFMGCEFAQFREWNYDDSLEWFMLDYKEHSSFREYVCELNEFYLSEPSLWERDFDSSGFEWILPDEADKNTVAFKRISGEGEVIVVISFSGAWQYIRLPLDFPENLSVVFDSRGEIWEKALQTTSDKDNYFCDIALPPYRGIIMKSEEKSKKIKLKRGEDNVPEKRTDCNAAGRRTGLKAL